MDALLRQVKVLEASVGIADRIRQRTWAREGDDRSPAYMRVWYGCFSLSEAYQAARRANRAQYARVHERQAAGSATLDSWVYPTASEASLTPLGACLPCGMRRRGAWQRVRGAQVRQHGEGVACPVPAMDDEHDHEP